MLRKGSRNSGAEESAASSRVDAEPPRARVAESSTAETHRLILRSSTEGPKARKSDPLAPQHSRPGRKKRKTKDTEGNPKRRSAEAFGSEKRPRRGCATKREQPLQAERIHIQNREKRLEAGEFDVKSKVFKETPNSEADQVLRGLTSAQALAVVKKLFQGRKAQGDVDKKMIKAVETEGVNAILKLGWRKEYICEQLLVSWTMTDLREENLEATATRTRVKKRAIEPSPLITSGLVEFFRVDYVADKESPCGEPLYKYADIRFRLTNDKSKKMVPPHLLFHCFKLLTLLRSISM